MANATAEKKSAMGGSVLEMVGGIGAVVLAILGLLRISPMNMASIATILAGVALLFEGAAVASRFRQTAQVSGTAKGDRARVGGGTSMEVIGGIAGIALGVLALFGVAPLLLIPIANIVFGGALIFGSVGTSRLHGARDTAARAGRATSGIQLVVGLAAVALGILALLDFTPLLLSLISLLAVGATVLLSGSALSTRIGSAGGARHARPRHA